MIETTYGLPISCKKNADISKCKTENVFSGFGSDAFFLINN